MPWMTHDPIPLTRPDLPPFDEVRDGLERIWGSGTLTLGPQTEALERAACALVGADHCVAVSSCTSGLMLLLAALGRGGEVIMPSFTWCSTAHAALWNSLTPVFADIKADDFTLDSEIVKRRASDRTCAVIATNVFGLPPDVRALEDACSGAGVPLIIDAAQGLGSMFRGRREGSFGWAEVFSLSPTKVVTAMEGGLITTKDAELAAKLRSMRDYGKGAGPNGPDILHVGLSARLSEIHAFVGLSNMGRADDLIRARGGIAARYREGLSDLPGVRFQVHPDGKESAHTYFVIMLEQASRLRRDELKLALGELGIQTKPYFWPPVHRQAAARRFAGEPLPITEHVSGSCLALPLWSEMPSSEQDRVIEALRSLLAG